VADERREQAQAAAAEAQVDRAEARQLAESAKVREAEAAERIAAARAMQEEAEQRLREAQESAQRARRREAEAEEQLRAAMETERRAARREEDALRKITESAEKEAEARARATVAEEELETLRKRAESTQGFIAHMREGMHEMREQQLELQAELKEARKEQTAAVGKLEEIETERNRSVWVRRDAAMRRFELAMLERDIHSRDDELRVALYMPLVDVGGAHMVPATFEDLGLDWWEIQVDGNLTELTLRQGAPHADDLQDVTSDPFVQRSEPRLCYVPVPDGGEGALPAIGIERLKNERIQDALLFKPDRPDESLRVTITPILAADYVNVKTAEPASRVKPRMGDYLLTERGEFIGVLTADNQAYVIPLDLAGRGDLIRLPTGPRNAEGEYEAFVEAARQVRRLIKSLR
jgi:hypothetical protein